MKVNGTMDDQSLRALLRPIGEQVLRVFSAISSEASARHSELQSMGPNSLATVNTFTDGDALDSLDRMSTANSNDLLTLVGEPAIARVLAETEDGKRVEYYICRATPVPPSVEGIKLVSYRAPVGRIASLPVGADLYLELPKGPVSLEVLERSELHPEKSKSGWDSRNSKLQGQQYGPLTITSLRDYIGSRVEQVSVLDELLAKEKEEALVSDGIRRSIRTRMALRDQPILDEFQDEIFRLPINSRLMLIGPPGSGKTTTLIRRLGQKLSVDFLDDNERRLVSVDHHIATDDHSVSWLMFTPTELLKQYVKEAFQLEGIPAPDHRIVTWSDFRRDFARNRFGVLKSASNSSSLVICDHRNGIQESTIGNQTSWFDDFWSWQWNDYLTQLRDTAEQIEAQDDGAISSLGEKLSKAISAKNAEVTALFFSSVSAFEDEVESAFSIRKSQVDERIERALVQTVNSDPNFLDGLVELLRSIGEDQDDADETELEDEEEQEPRTTMIGRAAAARAFRLNLRVQARAAYAKRKLKSGSKQEKISTWIGDRGLPVDVLNEIGESLHIQALLRRFRSTRERYLRDLPRRYRTYRRERLKDGQWYTAEGIEAGKVSDLEVDVILLAILKAGTILLSDRQVVQQIDEDRTSFLLNLLTLRRNQVMVDEVTDFSPVQVACMGELCDSKTRSFFASGDYNQRITETGCRSEEDMNWAVPGIETKKIAVNYRHSRQLSELAAELIKLFGGNIEHTALPEDTDNEGVLPVLGRGLSSHRLIAEWLGTRIREVETYSDQLPTIAVLVNTEEEVKPLADELGDVLEQDNLNVVPCERGQFVGHGNDIRVFAVEHIKGLEFEAVFFVGVDGLVDIEPNLFDKYLYVGVTRAATYLGVTCGGEELPTQLQPLAFQFGDSWAV